MKAVILAAGVGSRLGGTLPKCLIPIGGGMTILSNQVDTLRRLGVREVTAVVGFKKEVVMEHYPGLLYVYNPRFHITNTAYSLGLALERLAPDDVIWINGDVVFEEAVLRSMVAAGGSAVAVARKACGPEEVKYTLAGDGSIDRISKDVERGLGEAVGVNMVSGRDFEFFLRCLKDCSEDDYFEKAVEKAVHGGIRFAAVDVSGLKCIEVDFEGDLQEVKSLGRLWHT